MQKILELVLLPALAAEEGQLRKEIARATGQRKEDISGFRLLRRAIDARARQPKVLLTLQVFIGEPFQVATTETVSFPDVSRADRQIIVIGAGPAGLFAALRLIEKGIRPVLLERGKDVRARRRDLAQLNKEGIINPESNYCFGEGGAGTYSDGKLYTRSSKRGNIHRILDLFVGFGAEENILFEAHPHIGTNKLPGIISAMRDYIIECGGEIHFNKKMTGWSEYREKITEIQTADGDRLLAD